MIAVIIAGGSGTRLWPLSTSDYPKHLMKINGDTASLLQQTYRRAKRLTDKIYIVSEVSHIKHVRSQLAELPKSAFLVEPGRRGTANCILTALVHIQRHHDVDEPVAFLHADHYIRDVAGFTHSFRVATKLTDQEHRIVLVGVEPTYPATGFGYIEKGTLLSEQPFVFEVKSFREKPDFNTAFAYVQSGNYLWNCGYFVGSVNTFLKTMAADAPELQASYERLLTTKKTEYEAVYLSLANEAIDYALIEKVHDLLVVPAAFDWMDLGSFRDLAYATGGDAVGNHIHGQQIEIEEVGNSFIQNHEDKPLAVIGLDNVVVVNTPQGILVARKDLSQKVGDVSKRFHSKT